MKTITPEQELPVATVSKMEHPLAAITPQGITIESAFNAASSGKLDEKSLAVMKELLAMDAERLFNVAFVKLQGELPTIVADTVIPNRGKYARFEDVMRQINGALKTNGFSVSFTQEPSEVRIRVTCILRHIAGHAERNTYAVRVGKADTDTQADCKASTTAKRNALLQALNIVVRQDALQSEDDDATLEGDPNDKIAPAQVSELQHRIGMLADAVNMPAFWKFAEATKFADIPARKYEEIDSFLRRKEAAGR